MDSVRDWYGSLKKVKKAFKRPKVNGQTHSENIPSVPLNYETAGTDAPERSFGLLGQTDGTNAAYFVDPTPPPTATSHRPSYIRHWSKDIYAMPPSASMAQRVEIHHKLIQDLITFVIHPLIKSSLPPAAKVVDLNTGTGVFLRKLAGDSSLHRYELVGYDTIPEIFPGSSSSCPTCPANATFLEHGILSSYPKAHHRYFDLVHTSFLGPVLVAGQWDDAFDHMIELAKPGGWIQWIDVNLSSQDNKDRIYISKPGDAKSSYVEMMEGIATLDSWYENTISGGKRLKAIAKNHPCVDCVFEEVYNTAQDKKLRKSIDILAVQAWRRLLEYLIPIQDSGWDQERVERVVKGMEEEVKKDVYIPMEIYVVVAQKKTSANILRDAYEGNWPVSRAAEEEYLAARSAMSTW